MVVSAASSTLSADTHMDQTTWISTSRQAAHSMRALFHPTLILFVYLKCLIKPLLLLVLAQSCRVHGDPAATISRVSWLSCDWIQLHRVTTEGWWRADVWLNASITIRPDVCYKARHLHWSADTTGLNGCWWSTDITWKGSVNLKLSTVWRRFEPIPFGLSHHLHMHIHVEYITGHTGCGLKG